MSTAASPHAEPRPEDLHDCNGTRIPYSDCGWQHFEAALAEREKPPVPLAGPHAPESSDVSVPKPEPEPDPILQRQEDRLARFPLLAEPPIPWKSKTHHGEIKYVVLGGEGRWVTIPLNNKKGGKSGGQEKDANRDGLVKKLEERYGGFKITAPDSPSGPRDPEPAKQKKEDAAAAAEPAPRAPETALPEARSVPPELRELKRWVCWEKAWDDSKKKFGKHPHSPRTGKPIGATAKNAAEFVTFAEARAAVIKYHLDGVGFVFLEGDGFVGVDFDSCRDAETGALQAAAASWLKWFPTFQEVSPSGTGVHAIGRGKSERALAAHKIGEEGCTVEMYSTSRFFTVSGMAVEGAPFKINDIQPGIEKLLSFVGRGAQSETGEERPMTALTARKIHSDNLESLRKAPQGAGNETLNSASFFAGRAFAAGVLEGTRDELKAGLLRIVTEVWKEPHPEHSARATIESGWTSGIENPLAIVEDEWPEVAKTVKEFNERFFAVRKYGGHFRVCSFDRELLPGGDGGRSAPRERLTAQTYKNFQLGYINQRVQVGEKRDGEPVMKDKASVWVEHPLRREYETVVFSPGTVAPPDQYNLWRGFAFAPQKGDCSLYLAHLLDNICQGNKDDYRWLLQWMARQVRNPGKVGESAVVVVGDKGVGKNVFAEGFSDLWGQHGLVVNSESRVTRNFNAHLRDLCVLVADEAFFARDPRQVNQLKGLITGSTLNIEAKGVDVVTAPNLLRLIIISNDDHIVHASGDERRFFVLRCGDRRRSDTAYFRAIQQQLQNGGHAALLHHLLEEVDLAGFDVRNPPHTAELREQMRGSLTGAEAVWFDCLSQGRLPGQVDKDGRAWLRGSDLCDWAARKKKRGWDIGTHDVGYLLGVNPRGKSKGMGFQKGQPRLVGRDDRSRQWPIPSLAECRRLWDEKRFPATWEKVDGWEDCRDEGF